MTNSDRIRQMTDEQLAEFLVSLMPSSCDSCRLQDPDFIPMFHCRVDCETAWIKWLEDYDRHFWGRKETLKDEENNLEYKDYLRENMKTMMDSAKIPEGLQQKILKKEGLKDPQNILEAERT